MKRHSIVLAAILSLIIPLHAFAAGTEQRELLAKDAARQFSTMYPQAMMTTEGGMSVPTLVVQPGVTLNKSRGPADAYVFVREWGNLFGLDQQYDDISLHRVYELEDRSAYRFNQLHNGLTVLGADIVVTSNREGLVTIVSNGLVDVGNARADFRTQRDEALDAALRWLEVSKWNGNPKRVERMFANLGGVYKGVWVVDFFAEEPLGLWRVLVAADEPRVINAANLMKTAKGYAYLDCPEAGAYSDVTLTNLTSSTQLTGSYLDVKSYSGGHRAVASGGNFYYTPAESTSADPFAEVTTYYNLNRLHDYFTANSFNYLNSQVSVTVNYTSGSMACNAASGGGYIQVGYCSSSSPKVNFAYDASVVMHEYTHSAVFETANFNSLSADSWGLNGLPMGLHEGFSDSMPAIVVNDGIIGRHVAKAFGGNAGLRNLNYPSVCPMGLRGEEHEDGKVWGSANWAAFKDSGNDPNIGKVLLMALPSMAASSTFKDAANVVLNTANSYGTDVKNAFQDAYAANGVLDCGREAPVQNGVPLNGWLFKPSAIGCYSCSYTKMPFVIQYKLYVPAGATNLDVNVYATDYGSSTVRTGNINVYINQGSRVVFGNSPTAAWNTAGKSKLTINNPAAGWYWMLVAYNGIPSTHVQFSVTPEYFGVEPPDAGVDSGVTEDSGVNPDDSGVEVDSGVEEDGGVPVEDSGTEQDATVDDAGVPDGSGQGGDSGGSQDDTGLDDGGGTCECDQTYACDPDCQCDPECIQAASTGCSCSSVGIN